MLIQHILTAEIFDTVFGESHFHRENNIAKKLEAVVGTFFTGAVRRNTLAGIDSYYKAIKAEAARIDNHHEKQKFLKVIYENFYKAYNSKGADRLGIVYTPAENMLKINGGATIGFQAVENTPGKVNIANALTGSNKDQAPEGSGIIALLKFKVLSCGSDILLTLSNVKYMDSDGSNEPLVIDEIVSFTNALINVPDSPAADVNRNCKTDLADAVLALQVSAGMSTDDIVYIGADIDGDRKIGIPEAVYALRAVSETR